MRTKALILAAAFTVAGVATSMAQVYSANAVGYVNLTLVDGFTIIAPPLNGTNNDLNTLLPLPNEADGTAIYRYKPSIGNYGDVIEFYADYGWYTADPDGDAFLVINPGEGFWIRPNGLIPLNVTFVGEVPQGNLSVPVVAGNNFSLLGSPVPQALPLGEAGTTGTLEFPAVEGDAVYIFDSSIQNYKEVYEYYDGFGWYSANADDPGPQGPTIPVATGFFVRKAGDDPQSWDRQFSVN